MDPADQMSWADFSGSSQLCLLLWSCLVIPGLTLTCRLPACLDVGPALQTCLVFGFLLNPCSLALVLWDWALAGEASAMLAVGSSLALLVGAGPCCTLTTYIFMLPFIFLKSESVTLLWSPTFPSKTWRVSLHTDPWLRGENQILKSCKHCNSMIT